MLSNEGSSTTLNSSITHENADSPHWSGRKSISNKDLNQNGPNYMSSKVYARSECFILFFLSNGI